MCFPLCINLHTQQHQANKRRHVNAAHSSTVHFNKSKFAFIYHKDSSFSHEHYNSERVAFSTGAMLQQLGAALWTCLLCEKATQPNHNLALAYFFNLISYFCPVSLIPWPHYTTACSPSPQGPENPPLHLSTSYSCSSSKTTHHSGKLPEKINPMCLSPLSSKTA